MTGTLAGGIPAATRNWIEGNYVGIDAAGTTAIPNQDSGIVLDIGATNNIIGGTSPEADNVISGNARDGIAVYDSSNVISGNFIGTSADGTAAVNNGWSGIAVASASDTVIGGTNPESRNVIESGGTSQIFAAIDLSGTSNTNLVEGNYIGTNAAGTKLLSPRGSGLMSNPPRRGTRSEERTPTRET